MTSRRTVIKGLAGTFVAGTAGLTPLGAAIDADDTDDQETEPEPEPEQLFDPAEVFERYDSSLGGHHDYMGTAKRIDELETEGDDALYFRPTTEGRFEPGFLNGAYAEALTVPFYNRTDHMLDLIIEGSLYKSRLFGDKRIGVVPRDVIRDVRLSSDAGSHRADIVIYHDSPAYFTAVDNDLIEYDDIDGWDIRWIARRV